MIENKIPVKSEWINLSINQLYEVKNNMTDTYYNMKGINASFATQYLKFIDELDALISRKMLELEKDQD